MICAPRGNNFGSDFHVEPRKRKTMVAVRWRAAGKIAKIDLLLPSGK